MFNKPFDCFGYYIPLAFRYSALSNPAEGELKCALDACL